LTGTDLELIDAYRDRGERAALDALMRRHLGRIRNVVFQMVLDDALADDLTQDIFHRAVRGLPSFAGRSDFSTWLYRIAMNVVYSHIDRKRRSPLVESTDNTVPCSGRHDGPEQRLAGAELLEAVERAMAELSPKLRAAIVLTCLQGKSAAEAAAIEDCEIGTIYSRVHEARKQLKNRLGDFQS